MKICIDFDGTCVTHKYPKIGESIGAEEILQNLVKSGHKLILFTMRSGKKLNEAVTWFKNNGIQLYGINIDPTQKTWTQSPKAYAHLYIDDAGLGVPLMTDKDRPYVNWKKVKAMLKEREILKSDDY